MDFSKRKRNALLPREGVTVVHSQVKLDRVFAFYTVSCWQLGADG